MVMKKKAYNLSSDDDALDYVLGYSVGHDVSHRGWQVDRGGEPQPQFSMGKGAGEISISESLISMPNIY